MFFRKLDKNLAKSLTICQAFAILVTRWSFGNLFVELRLHRILSAASQQLLFSLFTNGKEQGLPALLPEVCLILVFGIWNSRLSRSLTRQRLLLSLVYPLLMQHDVRKW